MINNWTFHKPDYGRIPKPGELWRCHVASLDFDGVILSQEHKTEITKLKHGEFVMVVSVDAIEKSSHPWYTTYHVQLLIGEQLYWMKGCSNKEWNMCFRRSNHNEKTV